MRLTLALLKKKHVIPGNRWLGKHRLPHRISQHHVDRMVSNMQVEERNMFLLRHPYLTLEQEEGYDDETKSWHTSVAEDKLFMACYRVKPSVRVEEKLAWLNKGDNWETYK